MDEEVSLYKEKKFDQYKVNDFYSIYAPLY